MSNDPPMLIRRERSGDEAAIREVHNLAFAGPGQTAIETTLVTDLRASDAWIPALSLVAVAGSEVIGHVVCTRATLGPDAQPVLGLGPLGVRPDRQGAGVGTALMHAVIGAAAALEETAIGLLGDPAYYARFGFVPASDHGVESPDPAWDVHFQIRLLDEKPPTTGPFRYAPAFENLPTEPQPAPDGEEMSDAYEAASVESSEGGEMDVWDSTVADGLDRS